MPSFKLFSRRGKTSSSSSSSSNNQNNTESSSDYHRFSTSTDQPENDQQQAHSHVVRGALHTQNIGSKLYAPQNCSGGEQEIVSMSTGRGDGSAEIDIESSWLSNEGSSDKETSITDPIAPMNTSTAGSSAAEYIKKEKLLRKKAFNSGTLGGSIRFDYTVSDESSTNADLPYLHVHPDAGGTELRYKQQGQQESSIEWTPRDSSYGAAVSACGWVPKRIRRLIEAVFVILTFAILVFIVIKIGQEISSHAHSSGSVGDLDLDDDDHYIAHNNDNNGKGRFRYII